ncbi:MAG: hypothetical protein JXA42_12185 [Anaerolineales bacterium]|nr:hypothetical protein [Anaerolineales bacterium]
MTERQRFRETLLFGKPDRIPLDPGGPSPGGPRESTLAVWRKQGLPEDAHWQAYLMQELGIPYEPPDGQKLGVSFSMLPPFEEKVLERRGNHVFVQDRLGAKVEISDEYDFSYLRQPKDFVTRRWLRFPVQNRRDWEEKIKWRYNPDHPDRYPADMKQRCRALRDRRYVVRINFRGPFWQLRDWCGLEGLCLFMKDDPTFVQEMIDFYADFIVRTLTPLLEQVELDYVQVAEDMAYKLHSMISPTMARRFLLPTWQRWVEIIKASGCPIVNMHCDGYMAELLPLWIEAGFNCCYPVEVAAGNDIVTFRRQYGRQMAFIGGIDKRALAAGGDIMRAEVMRVVPPLLDEGGFIPACDHAVPPDVFWPDFVDYARLLAELTGWL